MIISNAERLRRFVTLKNYRQKNKEKQEFQKRFRPLGRTERINQLEIKLVPCGRKRNIIIILEIHKKNCFTVLTID